MKCFSRTTTEAFTPVAGEEPEVGRAQDNYLAFTARQDIAAGSGALVLYWPNAHGASPGCSSNASWPLLDAVTVLGIPPVDPTSVTVLVSPPPCCCMLQVCMLIVKLDCYRLLETFILCCDDDTSSAT